jgi:hypothetical protein
MGWRVAPPVSDSLRYADKQPTPSLFLQRAGRGVSSPTSAGKTLVGNAAFLEWLDQQRTQARASEARSEAFEERNVTETGGFGADVQLAGCPAA